MNLLYLLPKTGAALLVDGIKSKILFLCPWNELKMLVFKNLLFAQISNYGEFMTLYLSILIVL